MNTLVGLAAHILFLYSLFQVVINISSPMYSYTVMWEGVGALIIVTNIGHYLELKLQSTATDAYKKLDEMRELKVLVWRNGEKLLLSSDDVNVGEIIIVKKGALVPLDGKVLGNSLFDYSNITGESKELKLIKNQHVISGSFNIGDAIEIKVTRNSHDSTISVIIDKIEEFSSTKPKLQKIADQILKYFVPTILLLSLATFLVWLSLGYTININIPWINTVGTWNIAITASVTVLAIACPCAFGIATPLIYTVSSIIALKSGITINNASSLEKIDKIKYFAFDKTGTITTNNLVVSNIVGEKKYISIARGLEESIDHPIAKAINNIKSNLPIAKITNIKSKDGIGIYGTWNKKEISIRKSSKNNIKNFATTISLYVEEKEVLIFEMNNVIKANVEKTIKQLKNENIKTVMITGDNSIIADHIAKKVGIDIVYSNILPLEKSSIIESLQKSGNVLFVGDGFNDAIAIKQANISMAFVSGSNITNSLADVSILNNDFYSIYRTYMISKMNKTFVKLTLTWAFLFNILAIPLAIILIIVPWVGATLMATSNILISLTAYIYKVIGNRKIVNNK